MRTQRKRISALTLCFSAFVLLVAAPALGDPCLVVYPTANCTYHYDTSEYYTVTSGHPLYDPMYDRGGEVLIEWGTDDIDLSIYQAPGLAGFTPSIGGNEGYFFTGHDFDLTVDGFNNAPTTFENVLVVFEPDPSMCTPLVTVDGNPVLYDAGLGWYYPIGDLVVSTPTSDGNNYSDTVTHTIHFDLCTGMMMWAFADVDHDLQRTGGECFTAFSHDATVPAQQSTWGGIKTLYGSE